MARKEVLVQLDDELVRRLDALAARLGTSRSELVRRGAQSALDPEPLGRLDQVKWAELDRALRYALDIRY